MISACAGLFLQLALAVAAVPQKATPTAPAQKLPPPVLDTVGDIAFVPLLAEGFAALPLQQKILAYELSAAARAGDPITYDQRGKHFPLIRRVLEELVTHLPATLPLKERRLFTDYLKLFYVHHGYHGRNSLKFLPEFTPEQLERTCLLARVAGARFPGVTTPAGLKQLLDSLHRPLFDPAYEPQSVVKHPPEGMDILSASATNYYPGLTLREVERAFTPPGRERYPLNSTVVKVKGGVSEEVWRLGTADGNIPPGRYADELSGVVAHLDAAVGHALPGGDQQKVLRQLIAYFRTGEPEAFRHYNTLWVKDRSPVDTINGFIETYMDPRAAKGEFEAVVFVTDEPLSRVMHLLADNAQAYEDHAPYLSAYRRTGIKTPQANAVAVVTAGGGADPILPLGINLPNEQALKQTYGSKSVLLANVIAATDRALAERIAGEFSCTPAEVPLAQRHAAEASRLLISAHEVLGHGSGKTSPRLTGDPRRYLKEYYSTIEEARADLMALWSVSDPMTEQLHVSSGPQVAQEAFRGYVRGVLASLRRVPRGNSFEEDHARARQLVTQYLIQKVGAVKIHARGGKRAYCIDDFAAARRGVGELLGELMRIKAEGDYAAAKTLVETYGRTFEPDLRDEVLLRARALKLPSHLAMVAPDLVPLRDAAGKITDVLLRYPRDFLGQRLTEAAAAMPKAPIPTPQ